MSKRILEVLLLALILYAIVSLTFYRFSHPQMTDTELVLHSLDALLWRP